MAVLPTVKHGDPVLLGRTKSVEEITDAHGVPTVSVSIPDGAQPERRVAFLGHPASVTRDGRHTLDALMACGDLNVTAAFGPQHGMRGDKQDNMIESDDYLDTVHGIPVFSLYGEARRPTVSVRRPARTSATACRPVAATNDSPTRPTARPDISITPNWIRDTPRAAMLGKKTGVPPYIVERLLN